MELDEREPAGFYDLQSPCNFCEACRDIYLTGPEGVAYIEWMWKMETEDRDYN